MEMLMGENVTQKDILHLNLVPLIKIFNHCVAHSIWISEVITNNKWGSVEYRRVDQYDIVTKTLVKILQTKSMSGLYVLLPHILLASLCKRESYLCFYLLGSHWHMDFFPGRISWSPG